MLIFCLSNILLFSYQFSAWLIWNLWLVWFMLLLFSFVTSPTLILFLCNFIILLYLISFFSFTRSLLVPYVYVSIESVDCILLTLFELKAILSVSSVKTCCLLLNPCYVFNIDILFFRNYLCVLLQQKKLSMPILFSSE